ncbi:MAG: hypothetical protein ACREL5_00425 [Gemmatimonadales bacterium]
MAGGQLWYGVVLQQTFALGLLMSRLSWVLFAFSCAASVTVAVPLAGQRISRAGLSQRYEAPITKHDALRLASADATYWKRGALIGAAAGVGVGLFVDYATHQVCETSHCGVTVLTFLGPMFIFGLIGGLIGSGIHKT